MSGDLGPCLVAGTAPLPTESDGFDKIENHFKIKCWECDIVSLDIDIIQLNTATEREMTGKYLTSEIWQLKAVITLIITNWGF